MNEFLKEGLNVVLFFSTSNLQRIPFYLNKNRKSMHEFVPKAPFNVIGVEAKPHSIPSKSSKNISKPIVH